MTERMSPKFFAVVLTAFLGLITPAFAQAISPRPSPGWTSAMPPGPVAGTKMTQEYAKLVARNAYFWAWPLVNVYNRRLSYEKVSEIVMAGPVPAAPVNHLGCLPTTSSPKSGSSHVQIRT